MKEKFKTVMALALFAMTALYLSACAQGPLGLTWQGGGQFGNTSSQASLSNPDNSYEQSALTILDQNCVSCHGANSGPAGIYGLTDSAHLIASGLIVPGSPDQSVLFNVIASGVMPPGGALASRDQDTLRLWIEAMGSGSPAPSPTPAPTQPTPTPPPHATPNPGPSPTPTPAVPSFKNLSATIFKPKCVACHSASSADAGYAFDSYSGVMKAVNTKSPTSSVVYQATKSGSMPRGSSALTSSQLSQLLQWIQAGAPNN